MTHCENAQKATHLQAVAICSSSRLLPVIQLVLPLLALPPCSNPGEYAEGPGSHTCNVCPPGSFSPAPGAASCTACPAGAVSLAPAGKGAVKCQACPKGTWRPANATDNRCRT